MKINLSKFLTRLLAPTGFHIWHNQDGSSNDFISKHQHDLTIGKIYNFKGDEVRLERIVVLPTTFSKKNLWKTFLGPALNVEVVYSHKFYSKDYNALSGCSLTEFLQNIQETDSWERAFHQRIKEVNNIDKNKK